MKWLNVSDNELSELNITLQPQLSLLNANNNHIQTIDLSRNTLLQQIHLSGNRLSSLDVSKLSRLSWLKIDNNDISSLDLTNNSYLYWLECGRNHLAQLDLTHNTYLQRLEANDNSLSTLDLTHNVNLVGILIQRNSLTKDNLNAIIDGLKDVSDVEINENNKTWGRQLNISKMPGTVGADVDKATAKGWIVTAELPDGIGTATATLVPVRKFYFTVDGRLLGYSRPTAAGIYIVREMVGNRVLSAQKEIIK